MPKETPKYDPLIAHTPGNPWSILRFMLPQKKRVLTPLVPSFHFYFDERLLGYIFVQAEPKVIRQFLEENFVPCICIYDTVTEDFATMTDAKVVRLRMAMDDPSSVLSIMPHPIEYYAVGHDELICVNGPFPGSHGYVVRINRDRKFIFKIDNGITFGTSIINDLKFLTPEQYASLPKNERFEY